MNLIEQEACKSVTNLMLELDKDEQENGKSLQGFFLQRILQKFLVLGAAISANVPDEKADQVWQEYQGAVDIAKVGYNCNVSGWSKLLHSILILYLESPDTFDMFDIKIREAAVSVLKTKQKHTEKKKVNND